MYSIDSIIALSSYFCRLSRIIYYEYVEFYIDTYIPAAAAHDDLVLAIRYIEMGQRFLGLIDIRQ